MFVSVIVYVVDMPAVTVVTPSSFVRLRSAVFDTVSVSLAVLFPASESTTALEAIVAAFVSVASG